MFFFKKRKFRGANTAKKIVCDIEVVSQFSPHDFCSRWKSSRNIKITFSASAYKIVPRYLKSCHDFSWRDAILMVVKVLLVDLKIVARF